MSNEFNIDQDAFNQFLRDQGLGHYQVWKNDQFFVVRNDTSSFECMGRNLMDFLMSALNTYIGQMDDEDKNINKVTEDARFIYELIQYMLIQSEDLSIDKIVSSVEEKGKTNGEKYHGEKYKRFITQTSHT